MKKLLAFGQHRPDTEALSSMLDGRIDAAPGTALEGHVAACDVCRARLAELSAVRDSLRAMPAAETPRSFRLRAADVERVRPVATPGAFARTLPLVSAAAAAAFVVLIGAGVYANSGGPGSSRSSLTAYTGQQAKTEAQPAAPAAVDAPASDSADKRIASAAAGTQPDLGGAAAPTTTQGGAVPAPSGSGASASGAAPPAAPTALAYSDSAAPSGGSHDNTDLWWYAAAAAGIVAAAAAGAALHARRKRNRL